MGILRRLFSSDYRAAVAAEAAGDLDVAAERYVLAGQLDAAVRVHLARAERSDSRAGEIAALKDALHWAEPGTPSRRQAARALAHALLARTRAEGIATERDRARMREAVDLLRDAGDTLEAGEAAESIGDQELAAAAYKQGGHVERLEALLAREERALEGERRRRDAYADYELALSTGQRDRARAALRRCIDLADDKAEYRRLLDDLESRLITGGRALVRIRQGARISVCAVETIWLGRDPLCELPLRSPRVSRRHASVTVTASAGEARFVVADAGSRHGTLIGGMPIAGAVPLAGRGRVGLGRDCTLEYEVAGAPPILRVWAEGGMDDGAMLIAGAADDELPLAAAGISAAIRFRSGRPILIPGAAERLHFNGEAFAAGDIQLIRGDALDIGGVDIEVA